MTSNSSTILDGIALSQLAYEPLDQQISTTAINSAVSRAASLGWQLLSRTELGMGGLLGAPLFNGEYKYDVNMGQAFIAIRGREVALVFEGTAGPFGGVAEWITDLTLPATIDVQYLQYAAIVRIFKEFVAGFEPSKAYIFGHSLGGAMAEKFMQFNTDPIYEAVTFGSPGRNFGSGSDYRVTHIEHSADPVATGPWAGLTPSGEVIPIVLPEDLGLFGEHYGDRYYDTAQMLHESGLFGQVGNRQIVAGSRSASDSIDLSSQSANFLILGGGGGDTLHGGSGADLIHGGASSDTLFGEGGNDSIFGGDLHDSLFGGLGDDTLFGEAHEDVLRGEAGFDTLYGGSGWDNLYGDEGDDLLKGEFGNDSLRGGTGNDRLFGDEGDDRLIGEQGNDILDGGSGTDTAQYARSFQGAGGIFNYQLVSVGGGRFTVRDLASGSPEGTDTLERIEFITFGTETLNVAQWVTRAGGTAPTNPTPNQGTPYIPPGSVPAISTPTINTLLSVTPVNKQLTTGQSVALSDLFPKSSWVDNDGASDIIRFAVQDRSAGGGYLTYKGLAVSPNEVFEMSISELANWRFVAGSGAATDQIGFNIIQSDGDFSPRLTTGAVVTTVLPTVVNPVNPTPIVVPGTEVARLDLDLRNGSSADEGNGAQFTIQRRGNQDGDIVVEWRIEGIGDNPADRRDFPAMSGTVTLYDGRGDRNFSIGVAQDQVDELNESFRIELRVVSGNAVLDDDDANFTIVDDDVPLGINPNVDDHGNSLATATVVPEDRWARGFIEQPGDQDYFRFDLLGGLGYEFILIKDNDLSLIGGDPNANYPTLPQPITELYNANGQLIATIPATSATNRWAFRYETPADGTYYLRVRENGDNDIGQYFVQADIRVRADDFAANFSTSAVLAVEGSIVGHHERSTDVDWIAVDLVAGDTYRFTLISDNRLLVDGSTGGVNGSNGWYFFGWDRAGFSLVDSSGAAIASRTSGFPTSSNLFEFEAMQSGRFYVAVDGSTGGDMPDYVVNFDRLEGRPSAPALVLQPDSAGVADFRFASIRDLSSVAINDDVLTVNNDTSSAVRFDLTGQTATASYAAIELYLFGSGSTITGDIAVDIPLNALSAGSTFGDIGSIEFVTAVQTAGVGQWVTIEITNLYNQWISGERANNGILLSTTEVSSALMSFYSSNYSVNPLLRPRLVLDGPNIVETVYGQTTGAISEDGGSISGAIGLTGSSAGFADTVALGDWGSLSVDGTGRNWTYELDARSESLRGGQVVTENLVLTSIEGVSQSVQITVNGLNDTAIVIGAGAYQLAETDRSLAGRAAISDVDSLVAPMFVAANRSGTYGQFSIATDGSWVYALSNAGILALGTGATGLEQITLNTSDGTLIEFVYTISGTDNDHIIGTDASEYFAGAVGDDTLDGGSGNDTLDGGSGNDTVTGGLGLDIAVIGGSRVGHNISTIAGVTTVTDINLADGDSGTDVFATVETLRFSDQDVALAQSVTVSVNLTSSADIYAAPTFDNYVVNGQAGNDSITANLGNDTITGGTGNDTILGGAGNDRVLYGTGSNGFDVVDGGSGNDDRIVATAASVTIGLASLVGIEVIDAAGFSGVRILASSVANNIDLSATTLTGITAIDLGSGNDTLIGSEGGDTIIGGRGNDSLSGGNGDDVFRVGTSAGTDIFDGGFGNDRLEAIANNVSLAVTGANLIGIETISAGVFTGLTLLGSSAANVLDFSGTTLSGVARINGGSGNDTITGSSGNDLIEGGVGRDVLIGGGGADVFDFNLSSHSRTTTVDRVTDFAQGEDIIDLATIDADGTLGTIDAFVFISTAAFSGVAGQMRYDTTSLVGVTRILADLDGNRSIDMEIQLTGLHLLTSNDFML